MATVPYSKVAAGTNTLTALVNFNGTNGAGPYGGLIEDNNGDLLGTTLIGGAGDGTVFELTPLLLTPSLPNWTVNQPGYSQTITATGGTGSVTFAVTAGTLPTGLTLSSAGALAGTPTVADS